MVKVSPGQSASISPAGGEYPYHRGQHWAQASSSHAAELMQQVAQRRLEQGPTKADVITPYRNQFDSAICGARYRQRLEVLWQQRQQLNQRLRWKNI